MPAQHLPVLLALGVALTLGQRNRSSFVEHLETLLESHPERAIEYAVKGMLPKNRLGRAMFKKLKVYAGESHPHKAQNPEKFEIA